MTESGQVVLNNLRTRWADRPAPIIVFNKSHSGSRLLSRLLLAAGVDLGSSRNESEDAFGFMDLVRPMVERHYPDYAGLMRNGDAELDSLFRLVVDRHVADMQPTQRWGWKLCETTYILPLLWRVFPTAHFVHIVRDGRDVAFSNHVPPEEAFWRKIYFDTAIINEWRNTRLSNGSYKRAPHIFNARHWVNSVLVARHYGAMIGANYHEVRYEELVRMPVETGRIILTALGLDASLPILQQFADTVYGARIGKFQTEPLRKRIEAEAILRPTLEAFGFGIGELLPRRFSWLGRR